MRLAWATDIHLNFVDEAEARRLCEAARGCAGLVLTGDIAEADDVERWLCFLQAELGAPVWFVLGNHDFYQGSISAVRARAQALCERQPDLYWMQPAGVVPLTPRTGMVGVDGWGDGVNGDYFGEPGVMLNDFIRIQELREAAMGDPPPGKVINKVALRRRLMALGEEAAAALEPPLHEALVRFEQVLVLTHVPPFTEACWHEGRISDPAWLPHFTCAAVGRVLRAAAERWPARRIQVLCGHTHGEGVAQLRDNLIVRTGGAEYRRPRLAGVVEVD